MCTSVFTCGTVYTHQVVGDRTTTFVVYISQETDDLLVLFIDYYESFCTTVCIVWYCLLRLPQFQLKLGRRARHQIGGVVVSWFDILSVECSLSFENMDCPASKSEQWCCAFTITTTGYDSIPVIHGLTYIAIF